MPIPRFEVPAGVINGVNVTFSVSQPYMPGSTAVFVNGLLQEKSLDDGWFETDPATGTVTLKEAPRSSGTYPDVLQVFYLDTSPALPDTEVSTMSGTLVVVDEVQGVLLDDVALSGLVVPADGLLGGVLDPTPVQAAIDASDSLTGLLLECN
jgi:hypothetical protein